MSEFFTTLIKRVQIKGNIYESNANQFKALVHFQQLQHPNSRIDHSDVLNELIKRIFKSNVAYLKPFKAWLKTEEGQAFMASLENPQDESEADTSKDEVQTQETPRPAPRPKLSEASKIVEAELKSKQGAS